MKKTNFIIITIVVIIIISILTSYVTFLFLKGVGSISGRAGQAGTLSFGGLETGGTVNVIFVDSSLATVANDVGEIAADTVSLTVSRGSNYWAQAVSSDLTKPFLIRNIGTTPICITLYSDKNPFDQTSTVNPTDPSRTLFWISAPATSDSNGWTGADNCGTNCFKTADNKFPGDSQPSATLQCTITPSSCLNIENAIGTGSQKRLIDNTAGTIRGLQNLQINNELYLNVKIKISNQEGIGSKQALLTITGYDASGAVCSVG